LESPGDRLLGDRERVPADLVHGPHGTANAGERGDDDLLADVPGSRVQDK
jgi:hypothetical protein